MTRILGPLALILLLCPTVGALTHVRTISVWAPNSQPASLFLALFRKP